MSIEQQQPRPGDFAVVRMAGTVGRLIRLGQWLNGGGFADYEHAFVLVEDEQIVEAEPGGARIASLSEYDGQPMLWSSGRIPLTGGQRAAVCAAARGLEHVPYSFLDYLALAAHRFRLPLPGLRRYVANSRHLICSQLVDQCYQSAGVQLFSDGRWPGYVTPADLWKRLGCSAPIPGGVVGFPPQWAPELVARWLAEYEKRGEQR